jgi:hypothetical protein
VCFPVCVGRGASRSRCSGNPWLGSRRRRSPPLGEDGRSGDVSRSAEGASLSEHQGDYDRHCAGLPPVGDVEHDPAAGARSRKAEHAEGQSCPHADGKRRPALEAPSVDDIAKGLIARRVGHVVTDGAGIVPVAELVEDVCLEPDSQDRTSATASWRPSPSVRTSDTYWT